MQLTPFQLLPEYRDYVWGGERLRPGQAPTAEAWVIYENNRIAGGPLAGKSLAQAASEFGAQLLGRRVSANTGLRFPLLIKLLDCSQWLSLQVHPNDSQAVALEGEGYFGKTEAWHVIEAQPGAEILCGLKEPLPEAELAALVREGTILERVRRLAMHPGDTIFMRPGMLHALGPGLLMYEIQQSSDITYRVFDWNRPASDGRKLHIEKALAVLDADGVAVVQPQPLIRQAAILPLVSCVYFDLELLAGGACRFELNTLGASFHALTVLEGAVEVEGQDWQHSLGRFESLLVPASCQGYTVVLMQPGRVLKASA
jgi:mannose-6-phosphate isomerase